MKSTDRVKQLLEKQVFNMMLDLSQINLSEKLVDQKVIYIPKKVKSHNLIYRNH